MPVPTSSSRPGRRSIGAAALGIVVTLAVFVATFLAFLVAPLLLLAVAAVAYAVLRPRPDHPADTDLSTRSAQPARSARSGRSARTGRPVEPEAAGPTHAFGAGVR